MDAGQCFNASVGSLIKIRSNNGPKHNPCGIPHVASFMVESSPSKVQQFFCLGVYLPSAIHNITECNEYFDHLWVLYDSLSANRFVIVMGDFSGNLGNSLGDKAKQEPDQRGLKLLDFASYFKLCPKNLMGTC